MREKRKRESLNEQRQQNIEDKLGKIAKNLHTNVNYDGGAKLGDDSNFKRNKLDDSGSDDDSGNIKSEKMGKIIKNNETKEKKKLEKEKYKADKKSSKEPVGRKSSNTGKYVKKSKKIKEEDNINNNNAGSDGNEDDEEREDDSGMNDEQKYCICHNISYGNMVGCDNDDCEAGEWFHFGCVGLNSKPKGKWFCPKCREIRSKEGLV